MSAPDRTRAAEYADAFETAQAEFIRLVESLDDLQWRRVGGNFPQRLNDEDERRSVGVIAHHVALSTPWIMERIQAMLSGRPTAPFDIRAMNARHAEEHAGVTREEVLALLRASSSRSSRRRCERSRTASSTSPATLRRDRCRWPSALTGF